MAILSNNILQFPARRAEPPPAFFKAAPRPLPPNVCIWIIGAAVIVFWTAFFFAVRAL